MKTFFTLIGILIIIYFAKKINIEQKYLSNFNTDSNDDEQYTIIVKTKKKEDKGWSFFKEIVVASYGEFPALCEAAYLISGTDNPRINQADNPISATVVLRSKNISYRFEIKEIN